MIEAKKSSTLLFELACYGLILGVLYSRFLISISMLIFLAAALVNWQKKDYLKSFFKDKYYVAITCIFLLFTISGLWSENFDYFLNRTRIKLPLLFLPFAFYGIGKIPKTILKRVLLFFIVNITIASLWSIGSILPDLNHFIEIYGKGQIIPTPIHHIRFSILVSFAFLSTLYLLWSSDTKIGAFNIKYLLFAITALLFAYQHILAVRSGIMTLYIVVLSVIIILIFQRSNLKTGLGLIGLLTVIFIFSINYIPTIKNKISYMRYSMEMFAKNENIRDLSDSRRLGSIYAGLQLMKEHPFLGVGIGDIMDETNAYLKDHYPDLTNLELLPHNQYILSGACLGILGLLLFILFSTLPLFYNSGYNELFHLSTHLILFSSFMVEHTIESQIGVAVYIFFTLFSMKIVDHRSEA